MRKQEEAALALFAASRERSHDDILLAAAPLPNVIFVAERFFVDSGIVTLLVIQLWFPLQHFGSKNVRMFWCVFVAEISVHYLKCKT